jgi:non-specific protein-tyrosine kinase
MNTYVQIATSGPVLAELSDRLDLDKMPGIETESVPETELLRITVQDPNPALARDVANALADILIAQSKELYSGHGRAAHEIVGEQLAQVEGELQQARAEHQRMIAEAPQDTERTEAASLAISLKEQTYATLLRQYEEARVREALRANALSVVEPAGLPRTPAKPRKGLNIALGLMVGLLGGAGLAFLFENLDSTLYTTREIEQATGLPVLAKVPQARGKQQSAFFEGGTAQAEAIRRLGIHVSRPNEEGPTQVLLVTSAQPGEGKSTVVSNLALAIARSGLKVIVVDADLRRPAQHRIFRLPNEIGLSNVIQRYVALDEAVQHRDFSSIPVYRSTSDISWSKIWRRLDWLQVLTSGPTPNNPVGVLGSSRMPALLDQLRERYDFVLLDAPALLSVADAVMLVPTVDAVLLVVARGQARRETLRSACRELADGQAQVIGLVVNRAEQDLGHEYYRLTLAQSNGRAGARSRSKRKAAEKGRRNVVSTSEKRLQGREVKGTRGKDVSDTLVEHTS